MSLPFRHETWVDTLLQAVDDKRSAQSPRLIRRQLQTLTCGRQGLAGISPLDNRFARLQASLFFQLLYESPGVWKDRYIECLASLFSAEVNNSLVAIHVFA